MLHLFVRAEQAAWSLPPDEASPSNSSTQQQEEAAAVSAMLQAAGFAPMPPDTARDGTAEGGEQPAGQAVAAAAGQAGQSSSSTSQGRLGQVRGMLLEQQRLAAVGEARAQAEAAAKAATDALARRKAYKCARLCPCYQQEMHAAQLPLPCGRHACPCHRQCCI